MADSLRSLENIRTSFGGCGETNVWAAKKQEMTFAFEGRNALREAEEVGKTQIYKFPLTTLILKNNLERVTSLTFTKKKELSREFL